MISGANYWVAASLMLLLAAGCKPSVGGADARDRATPSFDRAVRTEQSGKLDEAITQYEQVLLDHPRLVSAHLHLALLLHDHRQDYFGAVYHYRQYLKLRPGGEKDELVEGRIRLAEQLLAAQLLRRVGDLAGIAQSRLTTEVDTLSRRVSTLEGEKATLADEKEKLTQAVQTSQREAQRLRHLLEKMQIQDQAPVADKPRISTRIPPKRNDQANAEPVVPAAPPVSRSALSAAREEAERLTRGTPPPSHPVEPSHPPAPKHPKSATVAAPEAPEPVPVAYPETPEPVAVATPEAPKSVAVADPEPPRPVVVATPEHPKPVAVAVHEAPKPVVEAAVKRTPAFRTYVVQPGDTLFRIAERHYGDISKWTTVRDANKSRISSDGRVRVGQILLIP
jgi:nucleoid-associated protein YgaU